MRTLEKLFERYYEEVDARWWIGKRPNGDEGQIRKAIFAEISYPTSSFNTYAGRGLDQLDWLKAAQVLALAGTKSLAYSDCIPSKDEVALALEGLKFLSGDAKLFSNGRWNKSKGFSWVSLTTATIDCGLFGYDNENAFIFWIEEED